MPSATLNQIPVFAPSIISAHSATLFAEHLLQTERALPEKWRDNNYRSAVPLNSRYGVRHIFVENLDDAIFISFSSADCVVVHLVMQIAASSESMGQASPDTIVIARTNSPTARSPGIASRTTMTVFH